MTLLADRVESARKIFCRLVILQTRRTNHRNCPIVMCSITSQLNRVLALLFQGSASAYFLTYGSYGMTSPASNPAANPPFGPQPKSSTGLFSLTVCLPTNWRNRGT